MFRLSLLKVYAKFLVSSILRYECLPHSENYCLLHASVSDSDARHYEQLPIQLSHISHILVPYMA